MPNTTPGKNQKPIIACEVFGGWTDYSYSVSKGSANMQQSEPPKIQSNYAIKNPSLKTLTKNLTNETLMTNIYEYVYDN